MATYTDHRSQCQVWAQDTTAHPTMLMPQWAQPQQLENRYFRYLLHSRTNIHFIWIKTSCKPCRTCSHKSWMPDWLNNHLRSHQSTRSTTNPDQGLQLRTPKMAGLNIDNGSPQLTSRKILREFMQVTIHQHSGPYLHLPD